MTIVSITGMLAAGCKENRTAGDVSNPTESSTTPVPVITINEEDNEKVTEETKESEPQSEVVSEPEINEPDPDDYFCEEEISDEIFSRMINKSYPEDCTVKREDLRYLRLLYKDAGGNTCEGEMICNKKIAGKLTEIFRQLYDAGYPIEKMVLIDEYGGDDEASMSDNNTSCFNYRVVSGTTKLSKHAMGLAVDLNPRYNPYIRKVDGSTVVEPANGEVYADRSGDFPYKIDKEDLAYRLFTEAGFTWGGSWKSVKDYQHFQFDN